MPKSIPCRLCSQSAKFVFGKKLLSRYVVDYYVCDNCNSLQTEEPYWLKDAYLPLNEKYDTGQIVRSLVNASFVSTIIEQLELANPKIVDYGSGSGLFVRAMRDVGFNAWGFDPYCLPRLSAGFCLKSMSEACVINLCEVAEHFDNPAKYFDEIFSCGPKVLIMQTGIFEHPDPNWGYLAEEHGQHIFFYSNRSIEYISKKYNMVATFINGFYLFFKMEYLEKLFNTNPFSFKEIFTERLDSALKNLFSKMLDSGYKYPIEDYNFLKETDAVSK